MKTPFTLLFCLICLNYSFANYLIDGFQAELPIETVGKMILIRGEVDGVEGYFLLDTGAPELILNKRVFPNLALGGDGIIQDVSDRMSCWIAKVGRFEMGNVFRNNFEAIIADFRSTETAVGYDILGLLGYDVLKQFEVRLDYYAGSITFCTLDKNGNAQSYWQPTAPNHSLDFTMEGHLPTIEGQLLGKDHIVFGLDSGASVNLMDQSYRGFLKQNCLKERKISFQCINMLIKNAPFFVMPQMSIAGAYRIDFWRTSITDFSHFRANGINIHAILGANFFQLGKISINYRLEKIEIWETPGRYNQRYNCLGH